MTLKRRVTLRDVVTTLLDTLGLLLVAAGAGFAAATVIGPAALAVAGLVVLAGTWVADHVARKVDA